MNALQLRPPSEESREHLLRRPVRRLPYPTTEHLLLGMFHSREEGDGQRTADQKLLMHIIQKRKKFNTAGGDLFACCIKNKFEIFNSLNDPVHILKELFLRHGGIYLCGLYIVMPQHLADGHYRHARFKNDERGKRVISKLEQNT